MGRQVSAGRQIGRYRQLSAVIGVGSAILFSPPARIPHSRSKSILIYERARVSPFSHTHIVETDHHTSPRFAFCPEHHTSNPSPSPMNLHSPSPIAKPNHRDSPFSIPHTTSLPSSRRYPNHCDSSPPPRHLPHEAFGLVPLNRRESPRFAISSRFSPIQTSDLFWTEIRERESRRKDSGRTETPPERRFLRLRRLLMKVELHRCKTQRNHENASNRT